MRQGDYQRLQDLTAIRPVAPETPPLLTGATHQVAWIDDRQVEVTSNLLLTVPSTSAATWRVPIARSREISAAVDGRETWLIHNHLNPSEPEFDSVDRDWSIRQILGVGPLMRAVQA